MTDTLLGYTLPKQYQTPEFISIIEEVKSVVCNEKMLDESMLNKYTEFSRSIILAAIDTFNVNPLKSTTLVVIQAAVNWMIQSELNEA